MPKLFATQPEMAEQPAAPEPVAEVVTPSIEMGTDIANAIVTRAPLSMAQLEVAIAHYAELEAMLRKSGPRFTNARRDAADMHNRVLALIAEAEAKAAGRPAPPERYPLQA